MGVLSLISCLLKCQVPGYCCRDMPVFIFIAFLVVVFFLLPFFFFFFFSWLRLRKRRRGNIPKRQPVISDFLRAVRTVVSCTDRGIDVVGVCKRLPQLREFHDTPGVQASINRPHQYTVLVLRTMQYTVHREESFNQSHASFPTTVEPQALGCTYSSSSSYYHYYHFVLLSHTNQSHLPSSSSPSSLPPQSLLLLLLQQWTRP